MDCELLRKLHDIGCRPWQDYLYVFHDITIKSCTGLYRDIWENEIVSTEDLEVNIRFKGWKSKVVIGDGVQLSNRVELNLGSNCYVEIGKGGKLLESGVIRCEDNSSIKIGERSVWGRSKIVSRNKIEIGNGCTFNDGIIIICESDNKIEIGNNVLISSNVHMRSGNGHSLFVAGTKENISQKNEYIFIGDHVWIGQDTTVLSNTKLMDESVVGAKSLVKGKYLPNSLCYGVPARMRRQDICWDVENGLSYEDYLDKRKE